MKQHKDENVVVVAQTGYGKTEAGLLWIGNNKGFFTLPLRVAINSIFSRVKNQIIIEKTEALISIDVNTGQNTGNKTSQELIFQTNLEATKEIARQIKLRNLAGIIIVDFIDMKKNSDKKIILEEFKKYLSEDRVEINSLEYTNLGLIQFTRKRQGKELAFYYREKCQYCEGIGYFLSKDRIILNLLEDLSSQIKSQDIKKIVIRAKKDIIKEIKTFLQNYAFLQKLLN